MRKLILTTMLTSVAGYAWKNRHRLFGSQDNRSVSGPERYNTSTTAGT